MRPRIIAAAAVAALAIAIAGCGSSSSSPPSRASTAATTTAAATTGGPNPNRPEVSPAGDIPDNQIFVVYPGNAFTMKFPEGWAQTGSSKNVTFRDKNNIVRVVIVTGRAPTVESVKQELAKLKGARATGTPTRVMINGLSGVKVTYESTSAPNAVTGKRVTLSVDRYELAKGGKRVIADLGSPVGVDNVDGYRLMIQSLRLK